jgi:hypothetical protein
MVVTKVDSYGNIYLSYHTTDTLNKAFSAIDSNYPNAKYYGWKMGRSSKILHNDVRVVSTPLTLVFRRMA